MPSRKELRAVLTAITTESFASAVALNKTNYSEAEANQIQMQALVSYHDLIYVDEVLAKVNASTTNLNITLLYEYMRYAYQQRTKAEPTQKAIFMYVFDSTKGTYTIGRNQAIGKLLVAVKETLNV